MGVIFNSAKIAPIKPADTPNRNPAKITGEAEGIIILKITSLSVLKKDLAISIIEVGVFSGSEQYLAYQRGTVDVGMTGVSGVKSRKLYEVMDTITVTNHADIEFIVVTNTDWWNGLTDGQRAIISDAAAMAEASVRDKMSSIEAEAYEVAKQNGMNVVTPSAADIAAFKDAASSVYDAYKEKAGDMGAKLLEAASKY